MNSSLKSPLEESSICSAFCERDTALDLSVREARASLAPIPAALPTDRYPVPQSLCENDVNSPVPMTVVSTTFYFEVTF